jgi:hypothetical protein
MHHRRGQSSRHMEAQPAAVTANVGGIEARVQETVEGLKSTVHRALAGVKQLQEMVDGAKARSTPCSGVSKAPRMTRSSA